MKVLQITNNHPTPTLPIFGVFVKEQIASLEAIGVHNDLLFINGREHGKWAYVKGVIRIRKQLKKSTYDVIHCHHALSALCLLFSGKRKGNKVVVSFQNDPAFELGKSVYNYIKIKSDVRVFKNNSIYIQSNSDYYLPNGVDIEIFKPIDRKKAREYLGLDLTKVYLLFVSSNFIRNQKRYDRFLETLAILRKNYGYENIEEIKLINTSREQIPYYFNAANIHLLTSDFEGSPNSVKESMACNISVVSTDVGNVAELLETVNGSFVAENNTSEELALLLDKALNTANNNGREVLINQKLDMNSVALKLVRIYRELIYNN